MKFGETRTIGENDMYMVEVSSGGHSLFFGPANMKQCEKIAIKELRKWSMVKFHWLSGPEVVLGDE